MLIRLQDLHHSQVSVYISCCTKKDKVRNSDRFTYSAPFHIPQTTASNSNGESCDQDSPHKINYTIKTLLSPFPGPGRDHFHQRPVQILIKLHRQQGTHETRRKCNLSAFLQQ